jgi:hypothetical protein
MEGASTEGTINEPLHADDHVFSGAVCRLPYSIDACISEAKTMRTACIT